MARVVWSVREGKAGTLNGPELMKGYRSTHPVQEPKLGDVLYLPDGSGLAFAGVVAPGLHRLEL
jgi:hypothetical protein